MKVPRWLRRLVAGVSSEEVQRFDAALDASKTNLECRAEHSGQPWLEAARCELAHATSHREQYHLEAAWSALKSAEREMVRSLDACSLVAEARRMRNESDHKLSGWRQASVSDLLPSELLDRVSLDHGGLTVSRTVVVASGPPTTVDSPQDGRDHERRTASDSPPGAETPDELVGEVEPETQRVASAEALVCDLRTRLITAREIRDEHSNNVYHKYRILRRAVIGTSIATTCFLVALVVIVALGWVPDALLTEDSPLDNWELLLVVMALGVIGAYLSAVTELVNRDDKPSIPDLRVSYTLMGMRPIAGALGATVIVIVLQSALGDAVTLESSAIPGVAIAAGFTERLVTRTVNSAANAVSG